MMKIIFMGTPNFAVPILKSLSSKFEIIAAYTQPPKKKSRGQKLIKSAVHENEENIGIPVRFPENLNNEIELKHACLSNTIIKHSGGTDKCGCHTNRKTGEYHCHTRKQRGGDCPP